VGGVVAIWDVVEPEKVAELVVERNCSAATHFLVVAKPPSTGWSAEFTGVAVRIHERDCNPVERRRV